MISADNKTFKVRHMLGGSRDKMNLKWRARKRKTAINVRAAYKEENSNTLSL